MYFHEGLTIFIAILGERHDMASLYDRNKTSNFMIGVSLFGSSGTQKCEIKKKNRKIKL